MFTMNFQKRKKATLRSSKIILEDRRVAFFTLWYYCIVENK